MLENAVVRGFLKKMYFLLEMETNSGWTVETEHTHLQIET